MLNIFFASLIVMLASLSGVLFASKRLTPFIKRNLHFLVSFSSGVFLIVALNLSTEALEYSETIAEGLFWIFVGLVGTFVIFKLLPQSHHHHDDNDGHTHNRLDAKRIVYADLIHNLGDGILITSAFTVNFSFGVATTLAILIHELLQEISEFFVMKEASWSTRKALFVNGLTSSSIILGAIGSYFLFETAKTIEPILLGLAGGVFLVIVFTDLIPHSVRNAQSTSLRDCTLKHILWFVVGIVLMLSFSNLLGHEHNEEKSHIEFHSEDMSHQEEH